jgi:hypothetical protein
MRRCVFTCPTPLDLPTDGKCASQPLSQTMATNGLGIGGATPFHMRSNHQTAFNHSFRDTAPYNPIQPRVKCAFCGVWARKGTACYLCRRFVKGLPAPRDNSVKVKPSSISTTPQRTPLSRNATNTGRPTSHHYDPSAGPGTGAGGSYVAAAAAQQPRASSSSAAAAAFGRSSTATSASGVRARSTSESRAPPAVANEKIKCKSCGCWAYKGKPCSLCRTVTIPKP